MKRTPLETPILEFLSTDVFGVIQTGKRFIKSLNISFSGGVVPQFDFSINATNSTTGSRALTIPANKYMHLDSAGMELSFTGNSSRVTSFTVGYFVYAPQFTGTLLQSMWSVLPAHGTFSADYYAWRLSTWHQKWDRISELWYYNTYYSTNYAFILGNDASKWSGWYHVAFTYEKTTNAVCAFIDGVQKATWTAANSWITNGNSGG